MARSAEAVTPTVPTALKHDLQSISDRRYNVVVFGVGECAGGTSRSDRLQSDLDSAVTVFSKIVPSIQSQSVKDSFRLGKFNPTSKHPRPILIEFIRTADVTSILANKRNLNPPYCIKPDLSHDARLRDSILLKMQVDSGWCPTLRHQDQKLQGSRQYFPPVSKCFCQPSVFCCGPYRCGAFSQCRKPQLFSWSC